jgi:hypothetical protein
MGLNWHSLCILQAKQQTLNFLKINMKKRSLLLAALLGLNCTGIALAQDTNTSEEKRWTVTGENTILVNQSAFSNWAAGGINSFAGNLVFNYGFNYKNGNWSWDNKVLAAYGQSNQKSLGWRKNDDRLGLNTLLGYKATEKWLYTFFGDFATQFTDGYQYDKDNNKSLISTFLAPAYLSFGPGVAFKESDNLRFNLSPAAARLIVVGNEELSNAGAFGVDPGKHLRSEFGASFDAFYKTDIMENVTMENSLKLYSNYLEDPQNVDVDYTFNLFLKVNKYLSVNGGVQLVYDDNTLIPRQKDGDIVPNSARPALQVKQILGAGITYKF